MTSPIATRGLVCLLAALAGLGLANGCASRGALKTAAFVPPPRPASPEAVEERTPAPSPSGGAIAGQEEAREYEVRPGDSLWRISRRFLGRGAEYGEIAKQNKVADPSLIFPGQHFEIPAGAGGGSIHLPSGKTRPKASFKVQKRPNGAFSMGEKLTFAVQYFGVTAGYAILSIPEYSVQSGRPCFHVEAEAKTHPFFETFFKVQDRIETFIDVDALFPWRYEKHLHEGGFKADTFFTYDQRHNLLIDDRNQSVEIAPESQDVLSCFYLYRSFDLQPGREDFVKVAADDKKNYELMVKVLRKERVKVLAGEFDCVVVQPFLKFQGIFQQKGEVLIWLTDDARHVPVMIKSKIIIGTIDIVLQDAVWVQPQ